MKLLQKVWRPLPWLFFLLGILCAVFVPSVPWGTAHIRAVPQDPARPAFDLARPLYLFDNLITKAGGCIQGETVWPIPGGYEAEEPRALMNIGWYILLILLLLMWGIIVNEVFGDFKMWTLVIVVLTGVGMFELISSLSTKPLNTLLADCFQEPVDASVVVNAAPGAPLILAAGLACGIAAIFLWSRNPKPAREGLSSLERGR